MIAVCSADLFVVEAGERGRERRWSVGGELNKSMGESREMMSRGVQGGQCASSNEREGV